MRVVVDEGRLTRIDLVARSEKRRTIRQAKLNAPPKEDDRVAEAWGRSERRLASEAEACQAREKVMAPRREADKEAKVRGQVGRESATKERAAHAGKDRYIGEDGAQRLTDAPLDALRSRNVITLEQYEAGDRFRNDAYVAGMVSSAVADLRRVSGGGTQWAPGFMASADRQAQARQRYRAAEEALGPTLSPVVNAVAHAGAGTNLSNIGRKLFGRSNANEARASLIEVLKVGLDTLMRHYAPPARTSIRGFGERVPFREDLWEK